MRLLAQFPMKLLKFEKVGYHNKFLRKMQFQISNLNNSEIN